MGELSYLEIDRLAGLRAGHCWRLTHREGTQTVATVEAIATALGATVGWLAAGEGEPPTKEAVLVAVAKRSKHLALQTRRLDRAGQSRGSQ